jgi:hypothetical protein
MFLCPLHTMMAVSPRSSFPLDHPPFKSGLYPSIQSDGDIPRGDVVRFDGILKGRGSGSN